MLHPGLDLRLAPIVMMCQVAGQAAVGAAGGGIFRHPVIIDEHPHMKLIFRVHRLRGKDQDRFRGNLLYQFKVDAAPDSRPPHRIQRFQGHNHRRYSGGNFLDGEARIDIAHIEMKHVADLSGVVPGTKFRGHLGHPQFRQPISLVIEFHRDLPHLQIEIDDAGLLPKHFLLDNKSGAQGWMSRKRQLVFRRKDAHMVAAIFRLFGNDEGGFRIIHLLGDLLHLPVAEMPRPPHHRQLVAFIFIFREDIDDVELWIVHHETPLVNVISKYKREVTT